MYIGLPVGNYKITLLDPSGKQLQYISHHIGLGDPTVVDFELKGGATAQQEQMASPEVVKGQGQGQFSALKATFDQATILYNQQHYSEAAAIYEKALPMATDKNLPIVLARLADTYGKAATQEHDKDARMQEQQKAADYLQKAIQLDPNNADLHNNLGSVYMEMGKVAEGKTEFQKATDLSPEAAKSQKQLTGLKAMFDQATVLYNQQHFTQAAAMYEQALPLAKEKNVPIVLARLGDTYEKAAVQEQSVDARTQDQQKAIDYYQKAIQATPDDPSLHNNLGSVYAGMGKVADAQAEFQKAAELNPAGASGYYYNLGVVMVNQGKMDEAATSLKKATDLDPNNANAFYWYGMALLGKAEYKSDGTVVAVPGTMEAFKHYLKLQPNGQWAQAAQASLDTIQGKVPTEYKKAKKS
jgi:tetratricopeptide (TPR) repeat protein